MRYRVIANGSVIEGPVPPTLVGVLYEEITDGAASTGSRPSSSKRKPAPRKPRKTAAE